jgi:glyoxalase superfamily protein
VTSFVKAVTWDCDDALRVAAFWAAALGSDVDEESTPERAYVESAGWGGPNMWFIRVPEDKIVKNRLHFDLRPLGLRMDEEVERLSGLGATIAQRFESHVVMRDPEGNEFCVEPGAEETRS